MVWRRLGAIEAADIQFFATAGPSAHAVAHTAASIGPKKIMRSRTLGTAYRSLAEAAPPPTLCPGAEASAARGHAMRSDRS